MMNKFERALKRAAAGNPGSATRRVARLRDSSAIFIPPHGDQRSRIMRTTRARRAARRRRTTRRIPEARSSSPAPFRRRGALIFMGFHILRVAHSRISPWLFPYVRPGRPRDVLFRFSRNGASPAGYIVPIPPADSADARPLLQPCSPPVPLLFLFPVSVAAASPDPGCIGIPTPRSERSAPGCLYVPRPRAMRFPSSVFALRSGSSAESAVVGVDPVLFAGNVGKKERERERERERKEILSLGR